MAKEKVTAISKGLKTLFIIHGVVSIIFGLLMLFLPYVWARSMQYELPDPIPIMLIGAFTVVLAVKDCFGLMAKRWDEVRIIVIMEVVWAPLAALVMLYAVLWGGAPKTLWGNVVAFAIFAVAWIYFYVKYRI
jgi:hypothetical protein